MKWGAKGFRLPTEAEWEWAAKGGKEYRWAGTDEQDELKKYAWYAWYDDSDGGDAKDKTHEVKKKQANGYGLYDMSGNVWEWCWDWYDDNTSDGGQDPTGAASGFSRVARGGCGGLSKAVADAGAVLVSGCLKGRLKARRSGIDARQTWADLKNVGHKCPTYKF